jgi:HSP20 family protein
LSNEDLLPAFHANVDIASDDKQYTISLEAPGMEQKDLSIELKDQALFIKGNKQQEQEEKDKHFYRIERHYGSFERVLAIPDDAETNKITASMKNGVLTIDIPRKEMPATEAKRITIES